MAEKKIPQRLHEPSVLMELLVTNGGVPLVGEVTISGAKNSALPIFIASLLTTEPMRISNIPLLQDIRTTTEMLRRMGSKVIFDDHSAQIENEGINSFYAPYELVKTMRASVLVLGALLSRYGRASVSLPGGCAIGERPINLHLNGLTAMGVDINVDSGYIHANCSQVRGAHITMEQVTVTGTENLMLAATLADGETTIENAACEPEVVDMANCLNKMGARIRGAGTKCITIEGVKEVHGAEYRILPDRIETSTFLTAATMTRGRIIARNTDPSLLEAVLNKLREAGAEIEVNADTIILDMHGERPSCVDAVTEPYPHFPTDMQAQLTAMNCIGTGSAKITDTVFERRFSHLKELQRMGANIELKGNTVHVSGTQQLTGASVTATDLRASASLVLAGLVAKGKTTIDRIHHLDRGYENIEKKLSNLGANIARVPHIR